MEPEQQKFNKYLFIVNPISGGTEKDQILELIEEGALNHQLEFKIFQTTGDNDNQKIGELIQDFDPEVVVAAGGDGTVNMVARHLLNTKKILGILPIGSGNGLAKDLEIPQFTNRRTLEVLFKPRVIQIDTLEANNKFFMHIADLGFNAKIVKLFNNSKHRGIISYMVFSVKEFFKFKTFRYSITTDSEHQKGNAFMIVIANTNSYGTNITINPDGKANDGQFEVVIIRRFPKKKILSLMFRLITRRINFFPYSIVMKCKKATINTRKKHTLQFDGEIAERLNKVDFSINPRSLNIIVPMDFEYS